jgi:hypothetical protein
VVEAEGAELAFGGNILSFERGKIQAGSLDTRVKIGSALTNF